MEKYISILLSVLWLHLKGSMADQPFAYYPDPEYHHPYIKFPVVKGRVFLCISQALLFYQPPSYTHLLFPASAIFFLRVKKHCRKERRSYTLFSPPVVMHTHLLYA